METNSSNDPAKLMAGPGMHVVIAFVLEEGEEQLEFDIVMDELADFARGFLGAGTPLAHAVTGHAAGEEIAYAQEDVRAVRVLEVRPADSEPPQDVKARRQEVLRKAVDASDRTNAVIFASSFSGKWGDYDPTGFLDEEEENKKGKQK